MIRMFSMWPMGVVEGNGWLCAITATAVIAIVITLFASGGSVRRNR